ncbi:hypothetical protein DICVIV_03976 [Dictyocaulus viviparus]|uniref:Ion transport domain-containing protein n=1 Tax=Dictyocaulus viviparus TaxID=29172 RepID=A0A0D8XZH3_DICVI|nr:hypothetical protein DICVIV_03976 [Dictyocaulus viviparus]
MYAHTSLFSTNINIIVDVYIPRMLPILAMLFVSLLAFGLIRESITYPSENWHWLLIRNIFYKPYFMLYGEVYAPEIDTCGDESESRVKNLLVVLLCSCLFMKSMSNSVWDAHLKQNISFGSDPLNITGAGCVPGYFIAPLFMTVFMLIANVLLMNTMVACCTYVFEHNVENTQEIWLYERYKLFLTEEQIEKIHSFEEECVEDMEKEKDIGKQCSNDERIRRIAERSEQIVNKLHAFENIMKNDAKNFDLLLNTIEARHKEEMDEMKLMNSHLEQLLRNTLVDQAMLEYPSTSVEPRYDDRNDVVLSSEKEEMDEMKLMNSHLEQLLRNTLVDQSMLEYPSTSVEPLGSYEKQHFDRNDVVLSSEVIRHSVSLRQVLLISQHYSSLQRFALYMSFVSMRVHFFPVLISVRHRRSLKFSIFSIRSRTNNSTCYSNRKVTS